MSEQVLLYIDHRKRPVTTTPRFTFPHFPSLAFVPFPSASSLAIRLGFGQCLDTWMLLRRNVSSLSLVTMRKSGRDFLPLGPSCLQLQNFYFVIYSYMEKLGAHASSLLPCLRCKNLRIWTCTCRNFWNLLSEILRQRMQDERPHELQPFRLAVRQNHVEVAKEIARRFLAKSHREAMNCPRTVCPTENNISNIFQQGSIQYISPNLILLLY